MGADMGRVIALAKARKTARTKGRPCHPGSLAEPRHDFSRTQAEAGIAHREWESRIAPLRAWGPDLLAGLGFAVFVAACIFIATAGQP